MSGPSALAPALSLQGVGKEYRLYASPRQRLRAVLTGQALHQSHWALQEVSLTLQRGECLGVIGDNGAGKSTLLKLLAGTLQPSAGQVQVRGRVTAILELGAGFHPEFSGRENLFFAGSLMGLTVAQLTALEAEIVDFAELHEAMHRPVKTYSSGMVVRLAFALVTAVQPDVLIIDEALAVGDQHFQKKCVERIEQFRRNGCTILFCSHSLYHVRQLCDAALWLDKGTQRAFGPTDEVLGAYEAFVRAQDDGNTTTLPTAVPELAPPRTSGQPGPGTAGIVSVHVADLNGSPTPLLQGPDLEVTVVAQAPVGECPSIGVMLEQAHGVGVTSVTTHNDGVAPLPLGEGRWRARVRFPALAVHTGEYVLSVYLFDSQGLVVYEQWMRCVHFRHVYALSMPGLVRLPHVWD